MRLLSHNLLACNVAKCNKNNFPLLIEVEQSTHRESPFNKDNLKRLIQKLDWAALHQTVLSMGENNFPVEPKDELEDDQFLKKLHRIILDTHIVSGKLKCPNCERQYPIVNGIPNMILHQNEL